MNLMNSVDPVNTHSNSGVMTDFSVYTQLPSMHTVLGSDAMNLLGTGRNKIDKDIFSNHRDDLQSLGRDENDLLESNEGTPVGSTVATHSLEEEESSNLQVYQWLTPS